LIFSLIREADYDTVCTKLNGAYSIKNSIISKPETALDGAWESINRENHNFSQRE
jgi:hypothetical protein